MAQVRSKKVLWVGIALSLRDERCLYRDCTALVVLPRGASHSHLCLLQLKLDVCLRQQCRGAGSTGPVLTIDFLQCVRVHAAYGVGIYLSSMAEYVSKGTPAT